MGLAGLTSRGWSLSINTNNSLTSFTGLDNIDAESFAYIEIYDNETLSTCEVQSIYNYLANPQSGTIVIMNIQRQLEKIIKQ